MAAANSGGSACPPTDRSAGAVAVVARAAGAARIDAFEAQRRFVSFVAHELRTPIALQRALVEVALADPAADVTALRQLGERIVDACARQEHLIEALLTLARSECGRTRKEPVDIAAIAAEAIRTHDCRGLDVTATLKAAATTGDPVLIEHLVTNLVANATRHNIPGGWLELATHAGTDRAIVTVANSGPAIPAGELARLFQPFQRLDSAADGAGLGLAIVQAIAKAHHGTVLAEPRRGGGLTIEIRFPAR